MASFAADLLQELPQLLLLLLLLLQQLLLLEVGCWLLVLGQPAKMDQLMMVVQGSGASHAGLAAALEQDNCLVLLL